jgi:hypothetical protein
LSLFSGTITRQQVAQAIANSLQHNRREVALPFMLKAFFALNDIAPPDAGLNEVPPGKRSGPECSRPSECDACRAKEAEERPSLIIFAQIALH